MISKNLFNRATTSLILLSLLYLIFFYKPILVFSLLILGILSIIEFINLIQKIIKQKFKFFLIILIFIFYIFSFCFFFFFFSNFLQLKIILFIILLSCIGSDIGGFIFGNLIGGPKLTQISPNKTISGAIGSIVLANIIFVSLFSYFTNNLSGKYFLIAIFISITCQFGDLFFSYLKRKAKKKDTGKFFPGHGGVLDRLDGILFGTPLGFLFFIFIY